MTEKRYGFEMDKNCYKCIVDTVDEKLYTDKKQVVDLLDELYNENNHLEKHLDMVREHRDELIVKNKELKRELEECRNNKLFSRRELEKENERLKEEIKSLTSNLEEDYILFKRNKNANPTKYCNQCWNYETETEEVSAFGDYETLTKISCSKGHSILDDTDATDCPDYDPKI